MFEVEDVVGREVLGSRGNPMVACGWGLIKTGSASRGERIAGYNRLPRVEEELRAAAAFAGRDPFAR